jgi:hypothetical protein
VQKLSLLEKEGFFILFCEVNFISLQCYRNVNVLTGVEGRNVGRLLEVGL